MKQAKVLTEAERKRLLAIIANDRHSERNRLAVMLSFLAGLRVGEIAALKVRDIVDGEGRVRDQLRLNPAYTKGGVSRTVFMNKRLQREIRRYLDSLPALPAPESALLPSQKGGTFSANSLCQLFAELYRRAGIEGVPSHSGHRSSFQQTPRPPAASRHSTPVRQPTAPAALASSSAMTQRHSMPWAS